jgi:hypothetical protein
MSCAFFARGVAFFKAGLLRGQGKLTTISRNNKKANQTKPLEPLIVFYEWLLISLSRHLLA